MTVKTKDQIIQDANALIPDNTSRLVSPEDVRERIIDIVDSVPFTSELPNVVTTGSYNDLTDKPALKAVATSGQYADLTNKPALSAVATTGSYNDLINRPILVPVATTGSYNDLIDKPAPLALAEVAYSGSYNDLNNKPVPPILAPVATTGSYADLTDKPPLGTIASRNANEFATSAQGTKADVAVLTIAQTLSAGQQSQARNNIAAFAQPTGSVAQYLRGDGSVAAMNKATVGLGNVDNTSDANKPVSNAVWTQLNARVTDTRYAGWVEWDSAAQPVNRWFHQSGYVVVAGMRDASSVKQVRYLGARQPQIYIPAIGWRALGGW